VLWHSDKPFYQKQVCEKISELFNLIGAESDKQTWFTNFIYVFNLHWDKVDNYRIDKYLMMLRIQLRVLLTFLKDKNYSKPQIKWFSEQMRSAFINAEMVSGPVSRGIPLHISDIFLQELNLVDGDKISHMNLQAILDPFLESVSKSENQILLVRLVEKVFMPLLEGN
jgi:ribosomal RNA-processing protein 1